MAIYTVKKKQSFSKEKMRTGYFFVTSYNIPKGLYGTLGARVQLSRSVLSWIFIFK